MEKEILLIDDDPVINYINLKIISSEFPETPIHIFNNGLSALEYLDKNPESSFLIFLDINMPVMNAWEFLESLSDWQRDMDLQIHILTSSVDRADRVKANEFGFVSSFLHKHLKKSHLVEIKKEFIKS